VKRMEEEAIPRINAADFFSKIEEELRQQSAIAEDYTEPDYGIIEED